MSRVHRHDYEMARVEKTVKILVCNAGSSSLKFEAEDEALMAEGGIDWTTEPTLLLRCRRQREIREDLKLRKHADAAARILEVLQAGPSASLHGLEELQGVGHRAVYGGGRYTDALRIMPKVNGVIGDLAKLAPLNNRVSLDGINAVEQGFHGGSRRACIGNSQASVHEPEFPWARARPESERILPARCRYCLARRGGTDPRHRHARGLNDHARDAANAGFANRSAARKRTY
jgi:Acetokinase family